MRITIGNTSLDIERSGGRPPAVNLDLFRDHDRVHRWQVTPQEARVIAKALEEAARKP